MRILLITIDALQPAYLGPYGNEWIETPTLDRWAAAGVVFDQHFADVPTVEAARKSWCSGRHAGMPATKEPDLFARLGEAGVPVVRGARGLKSAIDKLSKSSHGLLWFEIEDLLPPWKLSAKHLAPYYDAPDEDEVSRTVPLEPWLEPLPSQVADDDETTFERLQNTYAAADSKLDARLGDIADECARRGWDDAVRIVTAPRGLALGEHGAAGFPAPLHEELAHLPLLMVWPDGTYSGHRVAALTQPMDLAPTIAELFGIPWPPSDDALMAGRSLLPLVQSPHATLRPHAVTTLGPAIGVRTADWHWLRAGPDEPAQLFVKPDDRWEVNDVHQHHLEVCEELAAFAHDFAKRSLSPEAK
jgi:arylsulfatase A-like enzyme